MIVRLRIHWTEDEDPMPIVLCKEIRQWYLTEEDGVSMIVARTASGGGRKGEMKNMQIRRIL